MCSDRSARLYIRKINAMADDGNRIYLFDSTLRVGAKAA